MSTGDRVPKDLRHMRSVRPDTQSVTGSSSEHWVSELTGPDSSRQSAGRLRERAASRVVHVPAEAGDPFEDWPKIHLPTGTSAAFIDSDREET